jgi:iron complex outermembrane receptor protein
MFSGWMLLLAVCAQGADRAEPRREVVIVTGTYEPVPLEEADRAVRSLPVEEESLLFGTLADLLRLEPSVDLRQRAPGAVQADVSIRGGTFGQTLVLLDGFRLNDAQSGHHNMDIPVPLETLARIEVLKGSGSTLYGSDAVGGVVQFITRRPQASEFRLRGAIGNFGVNQQRGSVGLAAGSFSQLLAFSRDFSSGFQPNRDYRNLSLFSSTHWRSGLGATALLLAHNDRPFGAERFYGNFNSWERTKTWFAGLRQELGGNTEASFAFRRHTDLFVLYRDRPQVFTNRHIVEGFQGALRRRQPAGRTGRVYYGVEGYRDAIASTNLGNHTRARGAAYAAFDVRALRRFSFTVGAREEVYGSLTGAFTPSVSFGAWLSPRWKVRASAGRAFRLPSFTDLYYHDPANRGSPDLRPEKAWSYDGGLDWHAKAGLRGELTVFHRRERDVIDYVRGSPTDIWRATNIHRLRFTGVEAGLSASLRRAYELDLRYTALRGARQAPGEIQSRYVFNYPVHSGVASLAAAWRGVATRLRVGVLQRYLRDPYALVDLSLARTEGRLRPFVQLTNLGDTAYEEIAGVPMPGRAVVAGVEWVIFGGSR